MKRKFAFFAVTMIGALMLALPGAAFADESVKDSDANQGALAIANQAEDQLSNANATEGDGQEHIDATKTGSSEEDAVDADTGAANDNAVLSDVAAEAPVNAMSAADPVEANRTVEDGTYIIQTIVGQYVLDVAGGSVEDRANVWTFESNQTTGQQWIVTLEDDGYYSIKSVLSGKYLDVIDGQAVNGQNVWQFSGNGTLAQRWIIKAQDGAYVVLSALSDRMALDVADGVADNRVNVQLYTVNNAPAQRFFFISLDNEVVSTADVAEGVYFIDSKVADNRSLDVAYGSSQNGGNVWMCETNETNAQRWYISQDDDGFYTIQCVNSGKMLDVADGSPLAGVNVQQYASNQTVAQKWAITKNADGTFTFLSVITGMALDVWDGSSVSGTNVRLWLPNYSAAQKWVLRSTNVIDDTEYVIYSKVGSDLVIDVPNFSTAEDVPMQLCTSNSLIAQKFRITQVSDDMYSIQSLNSGLYLTNNGKLCVQESKTLDDSQLWHVVVTNGGIQFVSALGENAMITVANGTATAGTAIQVGTPASANAALFRLAYTDLITNGYYVIANFSGLVLDVADGVYYSGANIQQYQDNGSPCQSFWIENQGDNYVRISCGKNGKMVDVANGIMQAGTNVWQCNSNGSLAQLWKVVFNENGGFIFKAAANPELVLAVAGNSTSNGANVQIDAYDASATGQLWRLNKIEYRSVSGDVDLDCAITACWNNISSSGNLLYNAFRYVVNNYSYISGSKYPSGEWSIPFAKEMFNNHGGNCYRFASLFCWLAKSIGYNANVISGYVLGSSGYQAPHGWTEVHINGTTYVCDPDLQYESPGHNWYMNTYASAPTGYYFW